MELPPEIIEIIYEFLHEIYAKENAAKCAEIVKCEIEFTPRSIYLPKPGIRINFRNCPYCGGYTTEHVSKNNYRRFHEAPCEDWKAATKRIYVNNEYHGHKYHHSFYRDEAYYVAVKKEEKPAPKKSNNYYWILDDLVSD
nr:hypothetical protein K-LCC10_0318 [Kaumoebavirus]